MSTATNSRGSLSEIISRRRRRLSTGFLECTNGSTSQSITHRFPFLASSTLLSYHSTYVFHQDVREIRDNAIDIEDVSVVT